MKKEMKELKCKRNKVNLYISIKIDLKLDRKSNKVLIQH